MNCSLLAGVGRSICLIAFAMQMVAQEPRRVDLSGYGYVLRRPVPGYLAGVSPHIVSVGKNGETVVGFVTHDRFGLATRELPPLSFHVVRFAKDGSFSFQGTLPTSSWDDNAIFYGNDGDLLIPTGTKLGLYSPDLKKSKEMELPFSTKSVRIMWDILPLPNRKAFLLTAFPSIRLLDWRDLRPVRECLYGQHNFAHSVSNKVILFRHPSAAANPSRNVVDVYEICGPLRFSYAWDDGPSSATLLDDDSFILADYSPFIVVVAGNKVQWRADFDKQSDVVASHVEVSADGQRFAVAVIRFGGGNRFLDMDRKLKSARVLVFQAKSGQKLLDVPVSPTPVSRFDFALSPEGDTMAIVSDGILEIYPL